MDAPPPIPPVHRISTTNKRLVSEIFIAAVVSGFFCYMAHRADPDDNYTFLVPFGVGFLLGIFGRGTVLLTGPATMLALIVWSPIDLLLLHTTDHPFWPIEMIWYGVMACIGLIGAGIGRWIQRLWTRRDLKHDA